MLERVRVRREEENKVEPSWEEVLSGGEEAVVCGERGVRVRQKIHAANRSWWKVCEMFVYAFGT